MAEIQTKDSFKLTIETNSENGAGKVKTFADNYNKESPDAVTASGPSTGKKADSKIELTFKDEVEANKFLQKAKENQEEMNNLEIQNAKGQKIATLANGELKDINGKDITEDTSLSELPTAQQSPKPAPQNAATKPDDDKKNQKDKTLIDLIKELGEELWGSLEDKMENKIKDSLNNAANMSAPNMTSPHSSADQPAAPVDLATPAAEDRFDVNIKAVEGKTLEGIDFKDENLQETKNDDGSRILSFNNEASATKFLADAATKNSFIVEKDGATLATANDGKLTSADGSPITAESGSLSAVSQTDQTALRQ